MNLEEINKSKEWLLGKMRQKEEKRVHSLNNYHKYKEEINRVRRMKRKNKLSKLYLKEQEWYDKNRPSIRKYQKNYRRDKIQYKLKSNLRARLYMALKRNKATKRSQTMKYVGCSVYELKKHLESLFLEGMNWDNYGEWHIDHIYPISMIDLTVEDNIYKVMNYINLQPLWARDNIIKSNTIKEGQTI